MAGDRPAVVDGLDVNEAVVDRIRGRLMPVIVPALSCCWADAEPQRAMAATVIMMLAVFIGLSLFRARGTRRRGRIWFRKTA